ncbi:MAG: QueT transporter family protein [Oscillospiraceae bacterium]|nr:QueT transporter family protein [Oscillospiraceae bacterium]
MAKNQVRELTKMGVIAALYVALCYAFAFMSYGFAQFRVAEMLLLLVFYNKKYAVPVIIGTFIANQLMYGFVDMVFGTLATVLVCLVIIIFKNRIVIAPAAAVINGVIIGLMLYYLVPDDFGVSLPYIMSSVAAGEFAVVLTGVLAFAGIEKTNPKFIDMIKGVKEKEKKTE